MIMNLRGGPNTTPPWFQYKYDIVSVVIGSGIERIGNFAFSQLTKCENIYISDSVTSIADGAFCGCTGLTGITIPDSVTSIGEWAFYGCTGLTDITIPDSVTSIGECAFNECTGLTDIYYGGIEAQWEAVTSASVRKELENVTVHFASEPPEPLPGGTCGESSSWLLTTEGTLLITGTGDIYDYEFEGGP